MPTTSNPKHPNTDWYEELCALAAIGELSSSEFEELQQHLAECTDCRELYADFRRLSSDDLGRVAILKRTDQEDQAGEPLDEQALLSRFLDRAQRERPMAGKAAVYQTPEFRQPSYPAKLAQIVNWLRRPALSYGAVALLLCAVVGIAAYRLREVQLSPAMAELRSQVKDWKGRAEATAAGQRSTFESLQQIQSERETLQKSLAGAHAKYTALQAQEKALESELETARAHLDRKGEELETARNGAEERNKQIAELQTRLESAVQRTQQQRTIAENLQSKLERAEQASKTNTPESQGFTDAEAKTLFGARDLHIVDVYDIDGKGKTKRTYGRVYYVEKQLLVFYAFDLQDKRRNRTAAGFQAWGYRQSNETKPENLGLFSLDDASVNRWVLKVNNPSVLEHIDGVFVTLEASNGSPSPRGRKLLYANLAGPANHP